MARQHDNRNQTKTVFRGRTEGKGAGESVTIKMSYPRRIVTALGQKKRLRKFAQPCESVSKNLALIAAFWLMHGVGAAIPQTSPLANCEVTTTAPRSVKA